MRVFFLLGAKPDKIRATRSPATAINIVLLLTACSRADLQLGLSSMCIFPHRSDKTC